MPGVILSRGAALGLIVCACYEAQSLGWLDPTTSLDTYAQDLRRQVKDSASFHCHAVKLHAALKNNNLEATKTIAPNHGFNS